MSSGLSDRLPPASSRPPAQPPSPLNVNASTIPYGQDSSANSTMRQSADSSATPTRPSAKRDVSSTSSLPRKRISRACDACNSLRTKCNGEYPCNHCSEFTISCTYLRERKKRGKASRKDLAAQQAWLDAANSDSQTTTPPTPQYPTAPVDNNPLNNLPRSTIDLPSPAAYHQHSASSDSIQPISHPSYQGYTSENTTPSQSTFPAAAPDTDAQTKDQGPSRQDFQLYGNKPPVDYPADGSQPHRYQDRFQQQPSGRPPPLQTFQSYASAPNTSSHSLPSPSSQSGATQQHSASYNNINNNKITGSPMFNGILGQSPFSWSPGRVELPSPRGAFNLDAQPKGNQWLRYPVLIPILPRITAIIPVSLACDLLDIYFASLTPSVIQPASPYILAFTLRKKSVLRGENPRPCSKALLVSMLWVGAHTCEAPFLTSPPSQRAKVCNQLLELSISLLNPLVHVASQSAISSRNHSVVNSITPLNGFGGANLAARSDESGGLAGGTVTLDDVITYATIATVVSASEFKAASLRWWTAAFTVARELKLGKEMPDPADGAQYGDDNGAENARDSSDGFASQSKQAMTEETREERRRTWWLLYAVDRHIALCYNRALHLRDAECQNLLQPDLDVVFQAGDHYPAESGASSAMRPRGPCIECTGHGMFGYFLPLMTILGYIVDLNFAKEHPIYGPLFKDSPEPERHAVNITNKLEQYGASLARFQAQSLRQQPNGSMEPDDLTKTVVVYGTHLMHTLHVAMYGRWDPTALLDDDDLWISSTSFVTATQHAVAAAEAIGEILEYDPDLSFMPFFFGIYLLQGSFLLLLIADKLRDEANPSVVKACETIVRAHEVCVVTLNTEYQRNFRNVMRSALAQVKGRVLEDPGVAEKKRREVLALYRWTGDGTGLAL